MQKSSKTIKFSKNLVEILSFGRFLHKFGRFFICLDFSNLNFAKLLGRWSAVFGRWRLKIHD